MWKKGIVLLTVVALFISTALSTAAVEKQEEKKQSVKLELPVKSAILMEQKTGKRRRKNAAGIGYKNYDLIAGHGGNCVGKFKIYRQGYLYSACKLDGRYANLAGSR